MSKITGVVLFLFVTLFGGLLTSCGSVRDVAYFQTDGLMSKITMPDTFELRIQPDDMLNISVSSIDRQATEPFNFQYSSGNTYGSNSYGFGNIGFLVDRDGNINYPVLGKIKVKNMTRSQLIQYLQKRLSSEKYVKDPIVMVSFTNFKITILGEVARPGTYNVDKEKLTLFEALGMAGDLSIQGRRDRVAVLRERDGVQTILYHDLRSLDVMKSPYYYLEQNDVIYVEPNRVKGEQSSQNQFTNVGTWISLINFVTTMALLIFK